MPKYRVKPGKRFGRFDQHGPGAILELSEFEAGPVMFKLERVDEENASIEPESPAGQPATAFDVDAATIEEVLDAIDAGDLDAQTALDAERAGKNRVSLIRDLDRRLED